MPGPKFTDAGFMLHATVWNQAKTTNVANDVADDVANDSNVANDDKNDAFTYDLTEKELCIYQLVKGNPEISTSRIANEMHVTARTVQRHILMLKKKGFIDKAGNRKQVKWIILK